MTRPRSEIESDIQRIKHSIAVLPDSAVRMGYAEDYEGQLATLEEELEARGDYYDEV